MKMLAQDSIGMPSSSRSIPISKVGAVRSRPLYARADDGAFSEAITVEAIPVPSLPMIIENKYVEKVRLDRNPLFNVLSMGLDALDGKLPQARQVQDVVEDTRDFIVDRTAKVQQDPQLWGYHGLRTGFFIASGLIAARETNLDLLEGTADFKEGDGATEREKQKQALDSYVTLLMNYEQLYDLDADHIEKGYYRKPYDSNLTHRALNPAYAVGKFREFLAEAKLNIPRRLREGRQELPFVSGMYPEYYMNNYHFQSDGWLSSRSAQAYEFSTETLFSGSQDAMQRQILVPIHFWVGSQDKETKDLKVLEVAGGTGRLMTFFRDNYPQMDATLLDLSPYYLEQAQKNDDYYRKWFSENDDRRFQMALEPLKLVQGQAEAMKQFEDDSFDILNCVYLFHELPPEVRRECAKEFYRVLKPGGIVTFNDSIQENDRPDKTSLGIFADRYNEPYFQSYIEDDLYDIFEQAKFKLGPVSPIIAHTSKIMNWVKPL